MVGPITQPQRLTFFFSFLLLGWLFGSFFFFFTRFGEFGYWRKKEKKKKKKKKLHRVTSMGPTNSVKNIEWWEVSDGAKKTWYFRMMSDRNWVTKKSIQTASYLLEMLFSIKGYIWYWCNFLIVFRFYKLEYQALFPIVLLLSILSDSKFFKRTIWGFIWTRLDLWRGVELINLSLSALNIF